MSGADEEVLDLAGHPVRITHPDKVFFRKAAATKLDLVRYYVAIADALLAAMGGRPVLLQRFPDGASGKSFFQKRVPKGAPDWIQTTEVETVNGTPSDALVAADIAHVAWAVNMGCLGFHVWPFRAGHADEVDELRIDLDPGPGVTFEDVRWAASAVRDLLAELGMAAYPKTSGNRGIHVYVRVVPDYDSYGVRAAAVALARELERRHPTRITAAWWKEERGPRVFVDFNQNAPHKTVFGAWSVRARTGAQVSAPFRWDDLADLEPDDLTLRTVPALLAEHGDPWAPMYEREQPLEPLLEWHERDRAAGLKDAPWPPVYPKMPDEPRRVAPSRARPDG